MVWIFLLFFPTPVSGHEANSPLLSVSFFPLIFQTHCEKGRSVRVITSLLCRGTEVFMAEFFPSERQK